jgi:hypothetical protein
MESRLAMYRSWQIAQIKEMLSIARQLVTQLPDNQHNTLRADGTGWTVVEVICHLRDFDMVFLQRAELTVRQEYPELPFPDPDRLARERNYNVLDGRTAVAQWEASRRKMLGFFEGLDINDEETWNQMGAHPKRGPFSLNDQLMLIPRHDTLHLEQIASIIKRGR